MSMWPLDENAHRFALSAIRGNFWWERERDSFRILNTRERERERDRERERERERKREVGRER